VQSTAPTLEVQARLLGLEKEVATLKALLQSRDEELASRDSIISEEQSTNAQLKKKVLEANEWYTLSVAGLSSELNRADQLESRLRAVENKCSKARKNAEKEKLKAEVERLEAEKAKAVKA
jgi:chromosome segregation ATPase